MRKRDRYTSLFWAGVGLYLAYEGYQLKLGTLGSPQCGFFIFWTGMVLAGLSLLLFFQTLSGFKETKVPRGLWEGAAWSKGAKMMLALLLYALVFKWLGFILSTFLLLLFLFKGLEPQRWRMAFSLAVATTVVCYVVFGVLLELQFPPGVFKSFLE